MFSLYPRCRDGTSISIYSCDPSILFWLTSVIHRDTYDYLDTTTIFPYPARPGAAGRNPSGIIYIPRIHRQGTSCGLEISLGRAIPSGLILVALVGARNHTYPCTHSHDTTFHAIALIVAQRKGDSLP